MSVQNDRSITSIEMSSKKTINQALYNSQTSIKALKMESLSRNEFELRKGSTKRNTSDMVIDDRMPYGINEVRSEAKPPKN